MSGVRLIATFGQWWFPLPRPGFGDADGSAALSADDPGVGAQDPIAQGLAFGAGQEPGQAEQAEPGQQVAGDRGGSDPGLVDPGAAGGEAAQSSVFPVRIWSSTRA